MKRDIKKRILSILLICMLAVMCLPPVAASAAVIGSGSCGPSLQWSLGDDGTLTISGSGRMDDYGPGEMPWYPYLDQIQTVILQSGVTAIGQGAFFGCPALRRVEMADTVIHISAYAFSECTALKFLTLSQSLAYLGDDAFNRCESLPAIQLPDTLTQMGSKVFFRCTGLKTVTIPASVQQMGSQTFAFCTGLVRAVIQAPIDYLPGWTFYGCTALGGVTLAPQIQSAQEYAFRECENLEEIYCADDQNTTQNIMQSITTDNPQAVPPVVRPNDGTIPPASSTTSSRENGVVTTITTRVDESKDATVTTEKTNTYDQVTKQESQTVVISGVLEDPEGWQDVLAEAEKVYQDFEINGSYYTSSRLEIQVTTKGDATVPSQVLERLDDLSNTITITTKNDTEWVIDGKATSNTDNSFSFGTEINVPEKLPESILVDLPKDGGTYYRVNFSGSGGYKVRVSFVLPLKEVGKVATLFAANEKGESSALQSVYVAEDGSATYYLNGVDTGYQYYIGMNAASINPEDVLQPSRGNNVEHMQPEIQYVITGVNSSLGISGGQMTLFIIGGFVLVLGAVGCTMFLLNKRRLKQGYTMELDLSIDEEEVARLERKKQRHTSNQANAEPKLSRDERAMARMERKLRQQVGKPEPKLDLSLDEKVVARMERKKQREAEKNNKKK